MSREFHYSVKAIRIFILKYPFRYTKVPDNWEAPTPQPYGEKPNLLDYLLEPDAYDQYLIFDTEWHVQIWLNSSPHPTLLEDRDVRTF